MRTKFGTYVFLLLFHLSVSAQMVGLSAIAPAVKADQTIAFPPVADRMFGAPAFPITATASSGLAVRFTSDTTDVCVVSGNTATVKGAGACTLRASQAGNARYNAAAPAVQTFSVAPLTAAVTLGGLEKTYNGRQLSATCTTTPGGLKKTLTYSDAGSGSDRINAGSYGVSCTVTQPGYVGSAGGTLTIVSARQRITFAALDRKTAGDQPFAVAPVASSGLPVTLTSLTPDVCGVSGTVVTLAGAGTCSIAATQAGNGNYSPAPEVRRSFKIVPQVTLTKLNQIYDGTQKSAGCETAPSGLTTVLTYKSAGSGTGRVNAGNYWVTCTVKDPGLKASASGTLSIAPADQSIEFDALPDRTLGDPPFDVTATASSGLAVGFTSVTPDVCAMSGTTVTLSQAGTCTIEASQDGNINYKVAPQVAHSFAVAPAADPLHHLVAYDSALQGDWNVALWEDPDHHVEANPDAPAPGRPGNAIDVRYSVNGWGAFGLANMRDWNTVHYMYLNEFKTIEFDLFVEPDSTGLENLYFILDDAGYNDDRTLVSYIAGWDPAHPEQSYGRWIPIRIDLSQINPRVPRFMRFLFWNAAGQSSPHFHMANVRLGWVEDNTPPAFVSVVATPSLTFDRLNLAFTTDKATTYKVEWGLGDYNTVINGDPNELTASHTAVLTGVSRGHTYQYRITASSHHTDPSVPPTPGVYTGTYTMPAVPTTPPVIASFVATPPEIPLGDTAKLTWAVADYDTLTIDHGVGSVAQTPGATGVFVRPTAMTDYTITASNAMGSVTSTVRVITHAVPTVNAFQAVPAKINAGGTTTLMWAVDEFDAISIDHGIGVVTGTPGTTGVAVSPTETTTYVLTASNAYGTVRQTATVTVASATTNPVWVMGYYIGYQRGLQPPDQVDYSAMTHLIVGAVVPRSDGTFEKHFYIGDSDGPLWAKDAVQRAHAAGTKAILMVGGAGSIAGFEATSNPAVRAAFVNNLKAFVDECGFDGVDMDWEPLIPNAHGASFIALMQALQAPGVMPRESYIYTLPVGWNNANFNDMADPFFGTAATYFDRVSTMSYSALWIGDGWHSWHSSALFGETGNTPSSIDNTVQALRAAGVPDAKIGIGIGFYGTAYENGVWSNGQFVHLDPPAIPAYVTEPHMSTATVFSRYGDNQISYSNIMRYIHLGTAYRWDDTAKVPYLSFSTPAIFNYPGVSNMRTTYVTYDDEQAIAEKGSYVRRNGLGSVMIWTISQGYLGSWKTTGEKDPLMKAIVAAFRD